MKKIGITGSIASGKTTASKILSQRKGPLFSADNIVKKLYSKKSFQKLLVKKFDVHKDLGFKSQIKKKILTNTKNFKKLEKLIHPLVRSEMKKFTLSNRNKKLLFFEIPLLIESKLISYFDIIIFIKAKKDIRLKRFKSKGGQKKLFNVLNKKQIPDSKKTKFCDHIVVNEKNLNILKKKLLDIIKLYE
ncbi:dephospho-CoA kinase [Pelagibacteraceae bacterium]|nr:dephospho-CoA kinase [Pelagibacteraceae bacterium]